jgi:predicted enzyme related to lactoylglutathione lyase
MKYKLEHFALNVADPVAMAAWYAEHIGFSVVRKIDGPQKAHFLSDHSGTILIEIYNSPPDEVPDYAAMNPLQFHIALVSADPDADKARLVSAGASFVEEMRSPDGSHLVMLRDPWGLALQLCHRGKPMLREI